MPQGTPHGEAPLGFIVFLVFAVLLTVYCATVFRMKELLESPRVGLKLSGVMTFLFGAVYFQYFLRELVVTPANDPKCSAATTAS